MPPVKRTAANGVTAFRNWLSEREMRIGAKLVARELSASTTTMPATFRACGFMYARIRRKSWRSE